ncbi:MAG: hypothetical protein V3T70_07170 [Phycisphaerae bacterium]
MGLAALPLIALFVSIPLIAWPAAFSAEVGSTPSSQPASRPSASDEAAARRLLEDPAIGGDPLRRMLSLMDDTARIMTDEFDTGPHTQVQQSEILDAINDAIEQAKQRRSVFGGGSNDQTGESRRAGRRRATGSSGRRPAGKSGAGDSAAGAQNPAAATAGQPLADRPELRRGWGYLPNRDREAVLQGVRERFHARYRQRIEDYYRAIAAQAEAQP